MPTSNNPETTSRRAASRSASLKYPSNELLTKSTVLRFVEYQRLSPKSNATYNTTATIHLPLPVEIPENMQIKSGSTNLGPFKNQLSEFFSGKDGQNFIDEFKSARQNFGDSLPKDIARLSAITSIGSDDFANQIGIFTGIVKNPHTTSFFDGVELRTYNLSWNLSARSQQESDIINTIVQTLRERILPEEDIEGFTLEYPDLVFVSFEGEGKEYLPKFYKSFISAMNVNISSGEGVVFYKSGAPVSVQINLSFVETNILTRNVVRGD